MKEIRYDYLQSKPRSGKTSFGLLGVTFEEVMDLPITYLSLDNKLKSVFVDKALYVNRELKKLLTIGDLVNLGYDFVESYAHNHFGGGANLEVYFLQVALAKFSLKLKGSDFSVFEIDASDLELTDHALDWADRKGLETLGDFYLDAKRKLKFLGDVKNEREIKKSVLDAMKRFGVLFEGKDVYIVGSRTDTFGSESLEGFFPDILRALNSEKQRTEKTKVVGLEIFDGVDYSKTECDYSKLVEMIRFNFKTTSDFMEKTKVSKRVVDKIVAGAELEDKSLKKIYGYFKVTISDIVKFRSTKIKRSSKAGVGKKYNFSKAFVKIRNMYGSRTAFCKEAGLPISAIKSLAKGRLLKNENMRKICKALRCNLEDIMEVIPQMEEEKVDESQVYYDYSKFKQMLKERGLSFNKFFTQNDMPRNYICSLINSGLALSENHLKKITAILNCNEEDIFEVKEGKNPNVQCDYSKLKKMLKSRMISLYELCRKTGLTQTEISLKIAKGKYIGQEKLNKITKYFGCREEDIVETIKTREEAKEDSRKSLLRNEPQADYSKLFEKIEQEGLTFDEFCKKLNLSKYFKQNVRRNLKLQGIHVQSLCRYFKCKPDEFLTYYDGSELVESQKFKWSAPSGEQAECDYTELLKLAVQKSKNLQDFVYKVGLSRDYVVKINKGKLLDYRKYKMLMDFLNKPLDGIVKFESPEDRKKILQKIEEDEKDKHNQEVDYSGLYARLEERGMTDSDLFRNKVVSLNLVLYQIRKGKDISTISVKKICEFLNCEPNDIMTRVRKKKQDPRATKPVDPAVDYGILISTVNKKFLNLTQICRDVGINISYAHGIKMGQRIGKDKLKKICDYLGVKAEEVAFELKASQRGKHPQKTSFVNTSYGDGAARVKPAFRGKKDDEIEMINTGKDHKSGELVDANIGDKIDELYEENLAGSGDELVDESLVGLDDKAIGGSTPSKKPKGTKFYVSPKGFVKHAGIKFRRSKPFEPLQESLFEENEFLI